MIWFLVGAAALGVMGASRVQRDRRRRDEELGVSTAQAYRARGAGHLGQAPPFPHHKLGRD